MTGSAFITGIGSFLPGTPVANDQIATFLGKVGSCSSLEKELLDYTGIETRHYALDRKGRPTHSNALMAVLALHNAIAGTDWDLLDLDYLAAATTQGDLLVPGHACQVHAELGVPSLPIASFQSACAGGLMALRAAMLEVAYGGRVLAGVTASEFSSRFFRPGFYKPFLGLHGDLRPPFEAEFLRWTMSDGAGAVLVAPEPRPDGISFKIEWIDIASQADRFDPCLYAGIAAEADGDLLKGWSHYLSPSDAARDGALLMRQDLALLKRILAAWAERYQRLVETGRIDPATVDHFLCHYPAVAMRKTLERLLGDTGAPIPAERWRSTLTTKGNTGSAAIFVMLDELARSGRCRPGERILCAVPEGGRGLIAFMELSAV